MIQDDLAKRILILDGAMGTMIQQHQLAEIDFRGDLFTDHHVDLKGNNDLLSLTRPDIIKDIHLAYLGAGADILETNTFSSTSIAQADYDMSDYAYELNKVSAQLARQAIEEFASDQPKYVAGALGPTNRTASISPDVTRPGYRAVHFDELAQAYKEQASGLMDGGADLLLIETIFDTLNAKAAIFGLLELFDERSQQLPIMISGTITDASGRTLSGQTVEAFLISVSHAPILSVGLNCALGACKLKNYVRVLANTAPHFISAFPNAGLPNEFGEYDQSPEEMVAELRPFLQENMINIIGGCCGTTPEYIKQIADLASEYQPRVRAFMGKI
tara:strand:+ start:1462 stop:2454 length:993 start_codon:yes stop_codon:yes gene_type:complete